MRKKSEEDEHEGDDVLHGWKQRLIVGWPFYKYCSAELVSTDNSEKGVYG